MDPTTNNTFAYIVVAMLTSVTTIIVAVLGKRFNKKVSFHAPNDYAGYVKWVAYMEKQLEESQGTIENLRSALEEAKDKYAKEYDISSRRRIRLLDFGRKYGEDVSELV